MAIPSLTECLALMDHYAMLENIRRHSQAVAEVAVTIADSLYAVRQEGPARNLVLAGALLHDIAKTPCLHNRCDHARQGALICTEHGHAELAPIVAQHVILADFEPERYRRGLFTAVEIVYYADKRVRHEEVVSLEERLNYIIERYSHGDAAIEQRIRENFLRCQDLENCLFARLPFAPQTMREQVDTLLPDGLPEVRRR